MNEHDRLKALADALIALALGVAAVIAEQWLLGLTAAAWAIVALRQFRIANQARHLERQ